MKKIKYKIIEVNEADHQIVVRFYTDSYKPEVSAYDHNGNPVRYRTDYAITLPIPAPTGDDLKNFILGHAPIDFFVMKDKVADPNTDTTMADIKKMVGKVVSIDLPSGSA
jgi:hypothetical protein